MHIPIDIGVLVGGGFSAFQVYVLVQLHFAEKERVRERRFTDEYRRKYEEVIIKLTERLRQLELRVSRHITNV